MKLIAGLSALILACILLTVLLIDADHVKTRPSFPHYITCSGKVVSISYKDMADDWGEFEYNSNNIHIQPNLPLNFEQEVLLHEIMHCSALPAVKIAESIDEHTKRDKELVLTGDQWIKATTLELLNTLRENPALVKYLTE